MSRTSSLVLPARPRVRHLSFGPLLALTLLLSTGSLASPPSALEPANATIVLVVPRQTGTAQVVIVQDPTCSTPSPCLVVQELAPSHPAFPLGLLLVVGSIGLLLLRRAILEVHARRRRASDGWPAGQHDRGRRSAGRVLALRG